MFLRKEESPMARQPRFVLPGQPQHVIQRGNNRQVIFHHPYDYEYYLEKLKNCLNEFECEIHSYVLMTNHVHLLVTPHLENSISKVMQVVGRHYVPYFNKKYKRTGTLWEGRYKASLIDSENYLFSCMRYIELNPLRAKMVSCPSEYQWSSYKSNALGMDSDLITPHDEYQKLGLNQEERCMNYLSLFKFALKEETMNQIRNKTNNCWVLGDDIFQSTIGSRLNRNASPMPKGGSRKSKN